MPHFFLHVYISPHISRGRNLAVGESLHPDDTHAHASLHKFFTTQGLAQGCRLLVGVHLHRWYIRGKKTPPSAGPRSVYRTLRLRFAFFWHHVGRCRTGGVTFLSAYTYTI